LSGPGVSGTFFDPASPSSGVGTWNLTASYIDPNGCSNTAQVTITVDACASMDENDIASIKIYPNPNEGSFIVIGLEKSNIIEIVDINGKDIFKEVAVGETMNVKLFGVTSGVYYLTAYLNGQPKRFRLALL
jgi:hypothetical protein